MKIFDALNLAKKTLREKNIESFSLDSLLLMMHVTSSTKEKIIFNPDILLTQKQLEDFLQLVARRANREPVAHLLGKREFFGYDFIVSNKTLDPRPDSESLIEMVLQKFPDRNQKLKILEIGVGTGCLIITLLKNFANATGKGVDISVDALEICQKNAQNNDVANRLELLESDLFAKISEQEKFDLIISNPPYIKSADIENLQDEVRIYEPRTALDGGLDGLEFYRRIASEAKKFLAPEGKVVLEIGFGQEDDVADIFAGEGLGLRGVGRDLSGVVRVIFFD